MKHLNKLICLLLSIAITQIANSQSTGSVFRDYNGNGTKEANEPVVPGITVNAYNAADALVGTSTTVAAGTWSIIPTGGYPIRIEFVLNSATTTNCFFNPGVDFGSYSGAAYGSNVRFLSAQTAGVNYAISYPADYVTNTNPRVATSVFTNGNLTAGAGNSGNIRDAVTVQYNTVNAVSPTPASNITQVTIHGDIGSVWGVTHHVQSGKLFYSAVLKRHSGMGTGGSGAVYIANPATTTGATILFDLDGLGFPTRATGAYAYAATSGQAAVNNIPFTGVIGTNAQRGIPNGTTPYSSFAAPGDSHSYDAAAFAQVGKVGLGGIDVSDDGRYVFVMNLFDKKLYRITLVNPATPGTPAVTAADVKAFTLTDPAYAGGSYRPWAVKYYRGKVFVGMANDLSGTALLAGTTSIPNGSESTVPKYANAKGSVYSLDNPTTAGAGTFSFVTDIALNYAKLAVAGEIDGFDKLAASAAADGVNENHIFRYNPWTDDYDKFKQDNTGGNMKLCFPQPILSDIEFDMNNNAMVVSVMDRFGFQCSYRTFSPKDTGPDDGALGGTQTSYGNSELASGDVIKVPFTNICGIGTILPNNSAVNNEFYGGDYYGNGGVIAPAFHQEIAGGGSLLLPGSGEIMINCYDPSTTNNSGGLRIMNNTTGLSGNNGTSQYGANVYDGNTRGLTSAKGIAMGDIEYLHELAPIEVGNRVWNDVNGDGIQNAGEAGIGGVALEIFVDNNNDGIPDGAAIGTTTTALAGDIGSWYFNNANITGDADPNTAGTQTALTAGVNYIIRPAAASWAGGIGVGVLANLQLTKTDKIGNGTVDFSDNDAALTSGASPFPQISYTPAIAGANNHNLDFGFKGLASLGDKVWRDDDQDGIQDAGEPGVAGITVILYDNAGNVAATTVTDAYGFYLFDNLIVGTYQVGLTAPANYNFTTQTNNTDNTVLTGGSTAANGSDVNANTGRTANIVLSAGENERNIDAGLIFSQPINNSIGDRVWLDSDNNGNQNGTEPGISGVTVTLFASDGLTIVATTVTDANGNYLFSGLPATTNYIVGLTLPAGMTYTSSAGTTTGNATINSDVSATTGKTTLINTGAAGNQITGIDAGLILTNSATASMGDKVWVDLPGGTANVQDMGEPGLAGVTVNLYRDANADGAINGAEAITPYATTVTNAFGNYIFNNLPALVAPGAVYQVRFVLPGGYTFVTINVGTDDFKNSDADATGLTKLYRIINGQRNLSVDAGVTQNSPAGTARFGDRVWFDANSNGVQDAGEPDVAGVTVTLYNSGGTAIGSTTTDVNGYYQFINLAAATYSVGFSNLPSGYSFTGSTGTTSADPTINSDANPATGRTANFALLAAQSLQGLDCGLTAGLASGLGSIGNKVWYDLPGGTSGVQEAGELGVSGVIVTLLDAGVDGIVGNGDDGASRTTTTNALGEYIFTSLAAGNYAVQFSNLPGTYTVTTSNAGIDDGLDSDGGAVGTGGAPAGASRTGVYNLAGGEDNLTVDLGLVPPANTNTLGNYVWFDKNNDGIQDVTEQGLAGIMITLYNNAGTAIALTTTNVNGEYLFTGLADGNYSTGFTNLPPGFDLTTQSLTNTANGSDADRTSGKTATVTLNVGNRNDRSLDAGLISSRASLGNYVWMDSNGDGIQTAGEPAVPGATVSLFRPGFGLDGIAGNGDDALPVASMITDQNGQYLFDNLLPGTYQVAFTTIPTGIGFTQQDAGGNDNLDSDVNPATGLTGNIVLVAGDINLTVDAGLFKPRAVIGNYVWSDRNNNGIQDATEPGFAGVIVTLMNGATPVATAVTDANGWYLFPNVAPGTYSMVFTNLPTGVNFTIPDAGGNDNVDSDVIGTSITGIVVTTTTVNLSFDGGLNNAITLASPIEFTAYRKNTTAELNWKLSTAINEVKEFVVERSANGTSYAAIATVSSTNASTYKQIDQQPNIGINYYRIKIIYNSGIIKYSEVRVLNFNSKAGISVFPNPTTDIINIQLPDSWQGKALSIDLINPAGQVVNSKSTKQASQVESLTVKQMASGIYLLRIQDSNGNVQTIKIKVN
jgi:hypothetical protein